MRQVKFFANEVDPDNAGHFDADNVCSIALLKNGPTRSHVDMQMVGAKNLSAWVDNEELDESSMSPDSSPAIRRATRGCRPRGPRSGLSLCSRGVVGVDCVNIANSPIIPHLAAKPLNLSPTLCGGENAHDQKRNFLAYLLIMALMHVREEDQGRPEAPLMAKPPDRLPLG